VSVSEAASVHSLPRYVSSEHLPDWRTYAAYEFENLVMSGGGSKGYAYIGALKVLMLPEWSEQFNVRPHRSAARGPFSRIRQVASACSAYRLVHAPYSASAPYRFCPLLSRFEYVDRRTCPGMSCDGPFSPSQNLPFTCGNPDPHM